MIFILCLFILCLFVVFLVVSFDWKKKSEKNHVSIDYLANYLEKYYKENYDSIQKRTKMTLGNIPILFIVLQKNKGRVQNIQHIIKKYQLSNYHIIDAIDSTNLTNTNKNLIISDFKNIKINKRRHKKELIACLLSHLKACFFAYEKNYKKVLIVEDDVCFDILFSSRKTLNELWNKRPTDCEFLSLYNGNQKKTFYSNKKYIPYSYGAVSYIISHDAIKKYLTFVDKNFLHSKELNIGRLCLYKKCTSDVLIQYLKGYTIPKSIIIPLNKNLNSTLHKSHTNEHIQNAKISFYNTYTKYKLKTSKNLIILDTNTHLSKYKKQFPSYNLTIAPNEKEGFKKLYKNGGVFIWFDMFLEKIPKEDITTSYFIKSPPLNLNIEKIQLTGNKNLKYYIGNVLTFHYKFVEYPHEEKFCFIVPSYNTADIVEKNLTSIFSQKNTNWRVIFINDCSEDSTLKKAKEITQQYNKMDKVRFISNNKNYKQIYSRYVGYTKAHPDEIVIFLDGDDWLAHDNVLDIVQQKYRKGCDMTMGSYKEIKNGVILDRLKGNKGYPADVIKNKSFVEYGWVPQHLRTFRAKIIQNIPFSFLLDWDKNFAKVSSDVIESYWALLHSHGNIEVINDCLMYYNIDNSIKYKSSCYRTEMNDYRKKMSKLIQKRFQNI